MIKKVLFVAGCSGVLMGTGLLPPKMDVISNSFSNSCKHRAHGQLDMRYHQVNRSGALQTGVCQSIPEMLPDGRVRLHETWQWTSGDASSGHSVVEEIPG
jgi:hypothetical protein